MGLGDWERYSTTTGLTIDPTAPLVGSGSLRMHLRDSGAECNLGLSDAHPRGLLKGRVRTLVRQTTGFLTNHRVGLYCMAQALDITQGSERAFYRYCLKDQTLLLDKGDEGLSNGTTSLGSVAHTWTLALTVALELEWDYDLDRWGGAQLIGRVGTRTDFSDLSAVITVTDSSSPLATSVSEGLCGWSSGGEKIFLFDDTTIYPLL
jgi:hypothetical protein